MATKKSKKKVSEQPANLATDSRAKGADKKSVLKKKDATPDKKSIKKAKKPGVFTRIKKYFGSVRSEMKRCVWPTKKELINYSVAVCVSLIVVGVAIALVDAVISQGLVLFAGLRG